MKDSEKPENIELFSPAELSECENLPSAAKAKIRSDEAAGKYTAESLKKNKPQIYACVAALIGNGLPFTYISELTGVHFYTVEAVAQSAADYIAKCKERLAKMGFAISQRTMEKISENLDNLSLNKTDDFYKATLIANKLAENANVLSGGVTERVVVEHRKNYASAEEFEDAIWKDGAIDV
jgi:hypothetical protein|nr:MAG TPA: hypothetical protein [Caudoviricetes sp.]